VRGWRTAAAGQESTPTPFPSLPLILRPLPRILGYTADIAISKKTWGVLAKF